MKKKFSTFSLSLFFGALIAVSSLAATEVRDGAEVIAQRGDRVPYTKEESVAIKMQQMQEENTSNEKCMLEADSIDDLSSSLAQESIAGIKKGFGENLEIAGIKSPLFHVGVFNTVNSVSLFGEYITLNNGISWFVRSVDRYKTANFNMVAEYDPYLNTTFYYYTDNIIVLGDYLATNVYVLLNQTTGDRIQVDLIDPVPGQLISTYIVYDIIGNLVFLNDGSTWNIEGNNQTYNWNVGDSVIMGLADGFFSSANYPNVLINLQLHQQVSCKCIRY